MEKTVEKFSDTEVKIIKVTPEVVIPEKVEEEVISLSSLKEKIVTLDNDITTWTGYRDTPLAELAKIDKQIEDFNKEKTEIEAQIVEAEKQGVKDSADVKPQEEPIEGEPVLPVTKG